MKEPEFWLSRLAILNYRGLTLDHLVNAPRDYQRFTAEEVRECFARYDRADSHFRFVILPVESTGDRGDPGPSSG